MTFVDGIGRTTQTKHDASIVQLAEDGRAGPTTRRTRCSCPGAVEYDALGREVKEWWPSTEEGTAGFTTFQVRPAEYPPIGDRVHAARPGRLDPPCPTATTAEEDILTRTSTASPDHGGGSRPGPP